MALDVTPSDPDLTFLWEQTATDLPECLGFKLYWSDTDALDAEGKPIGYINVLDAMDLPIMFPYYALDPNENQCTTDNH